jgi:two-component system, NarL family, response regulator YdfI
MPIRLLIADDHLIVRDGLRLIFETDDDFELIGEAADGAEALRLAAQLQPDVVLMDLRMPVMDGLTAIERLQSEQPQIAVVILTTYNEDEMLLRGLRAGARGYLLKDTGRQALFDAIRAAARGETLLSQDIISRLVAQTTAPSPPPRMVPGGIELTARELEVLEAAARGDRSKEIAYRLGITERTVKAHLASAYNKLGVDSRAAAIAVALQKGLIQ